MIQLGDVCFQPEQLLISKDGKTVSLDKQSRDILLLLSAQTEPLSKTQLITAIWQNRVVTDAAITSAIRRIRKALNEIDSSTEYIKTLPKVGYQLSVPVDSAAHIIETHTSAHMSSAALPSQHSVKPELTSLAFSPSYLIFFIPVVLLLTYIAYLWRTAPAPKLPPLYIQAQHIWSQKQTDQITQAVTLLEKTLDTLPTFAPAHSMLAQIYTYKMSRYLGLSDEELIARGDYHLARAEKLGAPKVDVALARATQAFFFKRNLAVVEAFVQTYQAHDDCHADCHFFIAYASPVINRSDLAVLHAELAFEMMPDSPLFVWERAWAQFMSGNFDIAHERRREAEAFTGENNTIMQAMIAQANNDQPTAIRYWLMHLVSAGYLTKAQQADLLSQAQNANLNMPLQQAIADFAVEHPSLPIDQRAMLLLLAKQTEAAFTLIIKETSLQNQTHLLWAADNPVFKSSMPSKHIHAIKQHFWQLSDTTTSK
ncbi:transcriptional regulator [Thalassotalea euphylliae]|uniref:winged helix-turn-helix domain-containing protein n=1 Tax=Thalassotalea euphylliae TaxID=1655234 RepID=UPI00363C3C0C